MYSRKIKSKSEAFSPPAIPSDHESGKSKKGNKENMASYISTVTAPKVQYGGTMLSTICGDWGDREPIVLMYIICYGEKTTWYSIKWTN